jgi:hypothetical protein
MADNRVYVNCRWCVENKKPDFSFTLMRFGWSEPYWTADYAGKLPSFVQAHMHSDEPDWWTAGYVYNPFEFEYEDKNH